MKRNRILALVLTVVLLLSGCTMRTVDQMYCLPKRSEDHKNLRAQVEQAMYGLEYCTPLSGENQQTLQEVDLDGDDIAEYLLYAKGGSERPLKILIFDEINDSFSHVTTVELNGTSFDLVEYVQMEQGAGKQIVVGCQISDQPLRSVSVFRYDGTQTERLLATNYSKFMTVDLDGDMLSELFVLRPGNTETDNGVAELYGIENGNIERSNEVNMSRPADMLKRIVFGKLNDGEPAVYAASSVEDSALITDVFTCKDTLLVNVSFSNESGTSVKTLRNYYVYADDIDNDGTVELPALNPMLPVNAMLSEVRYDMIRWYSMKADGSEIDKLFTYHNFAGGWYMVLDPQWAHHLSVQQSSNEYNFYLWSQDFKQIKKVFTIYALTGLNRDELATEENRFMILKNDTVTYCGAVYEEAASYGIDRYSITRGFRLIESEWKTGET